MLQNKLSIFDTSGLSIGRKDQRTLEDKEYMTAHNYVLFNCPEVPPYLP
jgi:hypothetical protein